MWFLVGQGVNSGLRIWLKPDSTLTIGRVSTDGILGLGDNDNAVSRRHIAISVGKPTLETVRAHANPTKLTIRDLSTHGVVLNKIRIDKSREVEVEISESQTWIREEGRHVAGRGYGGWAILEIGNNTSFRLERVDINICSSGMDRQAKLSILERAMEIDAKVEPNSWISGVSTHLIMGNNRPTEKMHLALAEGGYLVGTLWLKDFGESLNTCWETRGQNFPATLETSYPSPVPTEFADVNVQWEPHFARRTLFTGYRFISFNDTHTKSLGQLIQCSGGTWSVEDPAKTNLLIGQCMKATQKPVFLSPVVESAANAYPQADTMIKKLGYRWVNEDEVGKAVIFASAEIFCNPQYMDPLPTHEEMSTMHVSQMPFTQYLGSMASMPAFQPTLKKGNSAGDAVDFPQVIDDEDDDDFWLKRTKKSGASKSKATSPLPASASPVSTSAKPPKKKSKTDRMAMFFEGLDDDDIVDLDPPGPAGVTTVAPTMTQTSMTSSSLHMPTAVKPSRHLSSLMSPIPVAWPEPIDLDAEPMDSNSSREQEPARKTPAKNTAISDDPTPGADEVGGGDEPHINDAENVKASITTATTTEVDTAETKPGPQDISPMSSRSRSSRSTKSTAFDAIRGDMESLKLDTKISRQKETLDEQQKLLRMGQPRSRNVTGAESSSHLMQSERSDQLLAKNKRRKLLEGQSQSHAKGGGSFPSPDPASQANSALDRSASVRILDEADEKDWPERWKVKPNFKTRSVLDPDLELKWKDRPNFKAFRKSTLPGVLSQLREPTPLTLDGKIVEKQESTIEKIGSYFKRESGMSPPLAPTSARKPSEKQMTRDDIKLLLADD